MLKSIIKKYRTVVDVFTTDIFKSMEYANLTPNMVVSGPVSDMEPIAKIANMTAEEAEDPTNIEKLVTEETAERLVKVANEREALSKMVVLGVTPSTLVEKYDAEDTLMVFDYRNQEFDTSDVLNTIGSLGVADYVAIFKVDEGIMTTASLLEDVGVHSYISKEGFIISSLPEIEDISKWAGQQVSVKSRVEKFDLAPFKTVDEVWYEFYSFFESLGTDVYVYIDEIGSDYVVVDWWQEDVGYAYYRIPFASTSENITMDFNNMVQVERVVEFRPVGAPTPDDMEKQDDPSIPIHKAIAQIRKDEDGEEKRFVLGVVLEPNDGVDGDFEPDTQGDYISAADIEKAAHSWFRNGGVIKIMHEEETHEVVPAETYIAPVDFKLGEDNIRKGSWLLGAYIDHDEVWELVKSGDMTGWSVGGQGVRVEE